MKKDQSVTVNDAVHKLQLSLLEGIRNENQLFAVGSLMSRSDYEDVVTERSIANLCGYPLCHNRLPLDRPRKGRYRVSLKEHKVFDLQESYMYCSSSCVVNSRAFAGSLLDDRCSVLNSEKLNEVLQLFGQLHLDSEESFGKSDDLGLSSLKIQEKTVIKEGEVPAESWMGPSNAIEGYVPQREHCPQPSPSEGHKEPAKFAVPKAISSKLACENDFILNGMDFMSTIIMSDEYSVSKMPSDLNEKANTRMKAREGKMSRNKSEDEFSETSFALTKDDFGRKARQSKAESSQAITDDKCTPLEVPLTSNQCQTVGSASTIEIVNNPCTEKDADFCEAVLKPSLKHQNAKKLGRSVTWADEKTDGTGSRNLCEFSQVKTVEKCSEVTCRKNAGGSDDDGMSRFASAEACAFALTEAAEAVASGEFEVSDAVSGAGIIILPCPNDATEGMRLEEVDTPEPEPIPPKWPRKPGSQKFDAFDPEDSWFDAPPEGFSLTLSPFATMWMALFEWISSSSLAYIYGRDDSFHEEYLSVNGREYPRKIILADGRSSEIKQTLAGCVARALPGVVATLRLPTPISSLEQGMGHLLDTMTFMDALPAFRMKQWQVIVLLFIEALSVCRIPSLTSHMTNRRMVLHKVLDGAQVRVDEYEVMKDLIMPLGRAPKFSAQSGA